MLNMKKGLAIVLAAATALTFAPVSTLGLTGVVEAQAAPAATIAPTLSTALGSDAWDPTDTNKNGAVNGVIPATEMESTVDLTAGDGKTFVTVLLTGSTTATDSSKFTIANDNPSSVTISDMSEVPADGITIAGKTTTPDSKKLVLKATKVGVSHIKVTSVTTGAGGTEDTQTLKLTITVNDYVSTTPAFEMDGKAVTGVSGYAASADKTVTVKFPKELAGNKFYYRAKNTAVSSVTAGQGAVAAAGTSVTVPMTAAGETVLEIYKNQTDATNNKSLIAKLPIKVNSYSFNVTASNLVEGKAGRFALTSVTNDPMSITIEDAKGSDVTSRFTMFGDTSGVKDDTYFTNPYTPTPDSETGFWVRPDSAAAGTYTITLTQGSGTTTKTVSATFTVSTAASNTDRNNTDADKSDVYGGVKDAIIATDNTTYSLVSSDVSFNIDRTNYTADQLKWYLTETPSTTPVNMGFTQGSAVITESGANGVGKLSVKVANAHQFAVDTRNAHIVGIYTSGAVNKIVYNKQITVIGAEAGVTTVNYDAGTIATDAKTVNASNVAKPLSDSFLNGIQFIGTNNKKLNGSNSTVTIGDFKGGINFKADLATYTGADGNAVKGSKVYKDPSVTASLGDGVYYETYYVPYTDDTEHGSDGKGIKFIAQINLAVSVNAGPSIEVREGNYVYSSTSNYPLNEKVIDLDLTTNKTFDLASHIYSSKDNTSYSYDVDTLNVTVSDKGLVTASKVGTAVVKITPKANGVSGAPVYVFFRVNANSDDQITVTGKDGDKVTVLTTRQYNGNKTKLTSERALAAAQVGYDQIEVTGEETADVKEPLTVKGTGSLSYALVNPAVHGESIDPKTGVVTISHDYLKDNTNPTYVFPVKVVSTETKTSALTTGYFYVVVDFADATVNGLQSSYDLGTSGTRTDEASWLNLGKDESFGPVHVSSNTDLTTDVLSKNDQLDNSKIYNDDDISAFINRGRTNNCVERATVAGKTEHLLITAGDSTHKIGNTYKVVTVKSVAGQKNYVTKITNAATGKTIYETNGVTSGASIVIDKTTVVKVSVAHTPAASLNPKKDPAFTIYGGEDPFNYNTLNYFVAATENPKTYEITLIPSQEGTQIVSITPTQGRLSETDYSLVGNDYTMLAVKYDTTPVPAKVTGLKIANKKGAAVKVTWKSQGSGIKYRVYKKVGNGDWVAKNVSSSSTSLKVKKGAKVTVKVKAYAKSSTNKTIWGPKATKASKKTDKK